MADAGALALFQEVVYDGEADRVSQRLEEHCIIFARHCLHGCANEGIFKDIGKGENELGHRFFALRIASRSALGSSVPILALFPSFMMISIASKPDTL
jgi:hypothetical protein